MSSVSLVRTKSQHQTEESLFPVNRERPLSEDWLFHGKDEVGREGWFLRIEVTGLYARRCGPFKSQDEACEFLDGFLNKHIMEALCEILSEMTPPEQACVVEGVPRLASTITGAECPR